jgi:hypothetical protein
MVLIEHTLHILVSVILVDIYKQLCMRHCLPVYEFSEHAVCLRFAAKTLSTLFSDLAVSFV